jgi:hypothetical protein
MLQLMRRAVRVSPIAVLTAIVAACGGEGPDGDRFTTRDSAGVKIVESMEGLWAESEGWRLSEEPSLTIGMDEGPEEYSLFRVDAVLRLPNGSIVIANSGTDELRFYDSSGVFLYSAGQDGYGPGEFKDVFGVWLVSDTLVINDIGQDRLSVFSASGEYERALVLDPVPGGSRPKAAGVFSDGSIVGYNYVIDRHSTTEAGMRFNRMYAVYRRHSRDGAILDSLGVFLWGEFLFETGESRRDAVSGIAYSSAVFLDTPFGRRPSTIASGESLYHGSSDSYEIQVFTKEGQLTHILRRPIPNAPVTAQAWNSTARTSLGTQTSSNHGRGAG